MIINAHPRKLGDMSGLPGIRPTPSFQPFAKGDIICSVGEKVIKRGTMVQHIETGDVGDVVWAGYRPRNSVIPPSPRIWDDIYLKVNVWRLGASRLWMGSDVTFMEDYNDTGRPDDDN